MDGDIKKMNYNKNIVLDILRSNFWDEIEKFVMDYVLDLENDELIEVFETLVDYAMLDYIEEMSVDCYEVEQEENKKNISGVLDVVANIDGYAHWDGEGNLIDDGEIEIGIGFRFYEEEEEYFDIVLEHLY